MLLFRSEEHVDRSGKRKGELMTPEKMWRLADTWYHDRDDPEWRRRSADEAEQVFADIGLTGEFWKLS